MEVGTPSNDVLDLLFDDSCGGLLNTNISSTDPKHGFLDQNIDTANNMAFQNIDFVSCFAFNCLHTFSFSVSNCDASYVPTWKK